MPPAYTSAAHYKRGVYGMEEFEGPDSDAGSDVDLLVSFDGPATSARYFGVQFYLEDLLGRPVDLVTEKAVRSELRAYIAHEAVHV